MVQAVHVGANVEYENGACFVASLTRRITARTRGRILGYCMNE
jgi:hypothetical protein